MNPKRPQTANSAKSYVTTPLASTMIALLGPGLRSDGVTLSRDETRSLNKLYGYTPEKPAERPPKPERKPDPKGASIWDRNKADDAHKRDVQAWEEWTDPREYIMQAGANRNMIRHAEHDGFRLVAWLAKYTPAEEDPLKTLIQLAMDAGWDIDPEDVEWALDEKAAEIPKRRVKSKKSFDRAPSQR